MSDLREVICDAMRAYHERRGWPWLPTIEDLLCDAITAAGLTVVPVQLLAELTDDAEALAQEQYGRSLDYPSQQRKFDAAMRTVFEARKIVAAATARPSVEGRQGQPAGEGEG